MFAMKMDEHSDSRNAIDSLESELVMCAARSPYLSENKEEMKVQLREPIRQTRADFEIRDDLEVANFADDQPAKLLLPFESCVDNSKIDLDASCQLSQKLFVDDVI